MTEQITIKLNKDKFEPLLKELRQYGRNAFESNSAMTAFCIWFLYEYVNTKLPETGKTRIEHILEVTGKTKTETMFDTLNAFRRFGHKGYPEDLFMDIDKPEGHP